MKLVELPSEVIKDLCQEDKWRLDIAPGFDSKHEFWMVWRHFIALRKLTAYSEAEAEVEAEAEDLAEFYNLDGVEVLLPVPRSHHPFMKIIRCLPSADGQTLTIFVHDSYHKSWFTEEEDARYGFLAIADRYQKYGCDFYLASYYHFAYLLNQDYETAREMMREKLGIAQNQSEEK